MSAVSDEREEAEQHSQEAEEMRTETLLREYEKDESSRCPRGGWQSLVWHAASLLRSAKEMRNTIGMRVVKSVDEPFVQDELF